MSCLPSAICTQIQSFAPEHVVKFAPVLRAIRFPRHGALMPPDVLRDRSCLRLDDDFFYDDPQKIHVIVEAIRANTRLTDVDFDADVDISILEEVLEEHDLSRLSFGKRFGISPVHDRARRISNTIFGMTTLTSFAVFVEKASWSGDDPIDWPYLVSEILTLNEDLENINIGLDGYEDYLCINDVVREHSGLLYATIWVPGITSFDLNLYRLCLAGQKATDVCKTINDGCVDFVPYLAVFYPDCENSQLSDIVRAIGAMIGRSSGKITRLTLRGLHHRHPNLGPFRVQPDDARHFTEAIERSKLKYVSLCTKWFSSDSIELIRAACERSGKTFCIDE